tara:strand:- start:2298 stop:2615 length:318 start_codon:yes stop_codon:yes gene_type:complete
MTKVDAFDIPKAKYVAVEMFNIVWNTEGETPKRPLPPRLTVTVDVNEGNVIAQAIDKATEHTGYAMSDVDFRPIDFDNVIGEPDEEASFDDTLEYVGEVYDKEKL